MAILVTGGAGFIGSHTCVELLEQGEQVVVFDNLSNSRLEAIRRVERITGKRVPVVVGDVRDPRALREAFAAHPIEAVIHFAGLKAVGESTERPLLYFDNNVTGPSSSSRRCAKPGCARWCSAARPPCTATRSGCR